MAVEVGPAMSTVTPSSTRANAPGLENTDGFGAGIADEAMGCAESCEPGADDGDVAVVRQLPWRPMVMQPNTVLLLLLLPGARGRVRRGHALGRAGCM